MDFFQNACFKKARTWWFKKKCPGNYKLVVPITYTPEKRFFTTATFQGLYVFTFQTE